MREDGLEKDVFSLIGPKKYDVLWKELEREGWIATASCTEIRVQLTRQERGEYAIAEARSQARIAAEAPQKLVKDPATAEWLLKDKKLGKLITASFSPQAVVIRRSDEREVRSIINDLGLMLPTRVMTPDIGKPSAAPSLRRTFGKTNDETSFQEAVRLHNLAVFDPQLFDFALDKETVIANTSMPDFSSEPAYDDDDDNDEFDEFDEFDDDDLRY